MAQQGGFGFPSQQPGQGEQLNESAGSPPPAETTAAPVGGKKKGRAYAGQAYEFGGNVPPEGQPYPGPGQQPQYGGFQAQPQQAQGYPQPAAQPGYGGYGQPEAYGQPGAPAGYAPAPMQTGYGSENSGHAAAPPQQGMQNLAQGMGNMSVGGQPGQPRQVLNHLYPVDLINAPDRMDVLEINMPPPPIVLPPNVRPLRDPRRGRADHPTVECDTFRTCELPPQIHALNYQRCTNYVLAPEEVEAAFCPRHPAIHITSRCRRPSTNRARSGHCTMPKMQDIHQPVRDVPRPRSQVAV